LANAVNAAAVPGVSATAARTSVTGNFVGGGVAAGTATVTINGKNINVALTGTGASDVLSTINAIRANSGSTGVTADAAGSGIRLTAQDGRNIDLAFSGGATGATADSVGLGDGGGSVVAATTFGTYSLNYQGGKGLPTLTIGGSAGADVKGQADNLITPVRMGTRLDQTNLLDFDGAKAAVVAIDDALNTIREERSNLGAYLNRFGFAAEHILNEIENLSASRSRIQDADYASEISQLLRGQVLQQAGNAMLVQANAQPRLVLALLM
jgi:flagellin